MGKQRIDVPLNDYERNILYLEKKYFNELLNIINSDNFKSDLLTMEKEIRDNYPIYSETWQLKNKLKVSAERLITHHIYMNWHEIISGIYPSPVSSDIGIKVNDAVICVDAKTIDINSNSNDLNATNVEENQTSFNNREYPFIPVKANLKSIDHYWRLPILTYIIKIVYDDNGYQFQLSRNDHQTISLVCIPNGELSKLFDYNIIANFKTYSYYGKADSPHFTPIIIEENDTPETIEQKCIEKGLIKIITHDYGNKLIYHDNIKNCYWWETSINNKKCIAALKKGSAVRFQNEILKERYDENNTPWDGYIDIILPNN